MTIDQSSIYIFRLSDVISSFRKLFQEITRATLALPSTVLIETLVRKTDFVVSEQQMRRSACASAQSDQRFCCSLPAENDISIYFVQGFTILASLCGWAGWFVHDLDKNLGDRFSCDDNPIDPGIVTMILCGM